MRFIVQRKRRGPSPSLIALSAFVAGAAAGTVAALLMAPASGHETRTFLRRRGRALAREAAAQGAEWRKHVDKMKSAATTNLKQASDVVTSRVMDALDGTTLSVSR